MSRPLFTNNAATALAKAITPTDTILQITAGTGSYFPQPSIGDYFMLTLVQINNPEVSEIVECIERVGDVLTVVRGQEGTQPQIFNISDNVELRITAGSLNLFAIGGGGGGSASGTSVADFTATQGQTVFTLPWSYTQGIDNLAIFINGSKQVVNVNYTESTTTSFTMASGLNAGDVVQAIYNLPLSGGVINSSNVTYNEQGTGAVNQTVQSKLQEFVSVKDFGAVGDGVTDDTSAFTAAFSTGKPIYIPYTSAGYLISSTISISSNVLCEGYLVTPLAFSSIAISIPATIYGQKLTITGLNVQSTGVRVAGSYGIIVDGANTVLDRCTFSKFDIGIQVRTYSVMLLNTSAFLCNTNLSAYAPSPTTEINDFKVIGGNYDSATQYSCRIGDPRFSTTVPSAELMGTPVLIEGANFDGATSTFDRIYSLNIYSCYWENTTTGNAIELGGAGEGWLRNVQINGCYFGGTINYAIYGKNAIDGIYVGPNYYGGNQLSALYLVNADFYGFQYEQGISTSGFLAQEVHTGYRSVPVTSVNFSGMSISYDFLRRGAQTAPNQSSTVSWYPYGKTLTGLTQVSSTVGRFKSNAVTGVAGTFSGNAFTCTTKSNSYNFNGGDRVTPSTGSANFVRYVDYVNGIIYLNDVGTGSATLSQDTLIFNSVTRGSVAPTTGTYSQGDVVYNTAPNAGSYIGWVCVTGGTPGTWKTFGAISS
jgi:hypothetical protein